jgi:hypothetical protein
MSAFPGAAPVVRGGFVLVDPVLGIPLRTIPFQFNPDTLTRTLQPRGIGDGPGDRLDVLRLAGPPKESLKFDAEFDAADQLDAPEANPVEADNGLYPVLSALELSIYPSSVHLAFENILASLGMIEIAPAESPLTVLVLGPKRVLPVRITDLSITEEAFDTALNPIRAKVSIGVRVLTVDDVGFTHKGGILYFLNHVQKEIFAAMRIHTPGELGLTTI